MLHSLNYLREKLVTLENKNQQVVFYISSYDYAVIIIVN